MMSPLSDDDFDAPEHSLISQVATWLERACSFSIQAAIAGTTVTGGVFLLYIIAGALAMISRIWIPEYSFLSITADPYFAVLGFLAGFDICIGTGALIILYMMHGVEDIHSQISALAAFIGFSFGTGVIRLTLPLVLRILNADEVFLLNFCFVNP